MRSRLKRLLRAPSVQAAGATLLGLYLRFAYRTTRWHIEGSENLAPHQAGAPVIGAFWHERLPLMPMLWVLAGGRSRQLGIGNYILVSAHRDGQLLTRILSQFGLKPVFGSSSKGGAASVRQLVKLIGGGNHLAITPDGPRGPRRKAAPGLAQLAALTGTPIMPCGAQTTRRIVLNSWDRMVIPRPFARAVIVCGPTIQVPRENWEAIVPVIEAALSEAAAEADRICRAPPVPNR
jgi:lysophospholipid acyltransferase (LPLAT)-like uncharacterized protein